MQQEISIYQTKKYKISGTSFKEVFKNAEIVYKEIKSKSKRTPYIRSKYFNKEKVFLVDWLCFGNIYFRNKKKIELGD